jgi:hypothetical protein
MTKNWLLIICSTAGILAGTPSYSADSLLSNTKKPNRDGVASDTIPTIHIGGGGGTQHGKPVPLPGHLGPLEQSVCEVAANKAKLKHPNMDMFEFMNRYGFFYFGPADRASPPEPVFAHHDVQTRITFYVESDGRHLTAIDADGKVLWVRNPFVDSNMCPYRSAHPYISWIGPPGGGFGWNYLGAFVPTPDDKANAAIVKELNDEVARGRKVSRPGADARFIGLTFNSSNFGYVNIATGDYYDMGQN